MEPNSLWYCYYIHIRGDTWPYGIDDRCECQGMRMGALTPVLCYSGPDPFSDFVIVSQSVSQSPGSLVPLALAWVTLDWKVNECDNALNAWKRFSGLGGFLP